MALYLSLAAFCSALFIVDGRERLLSPPWTHSKGGTTVTLLPQAVLENNEVEIRRGDEDTEVNGYVVCPSGSFCHGDGCPSNNATAALPRDRLDPDKCPTCSCSTWVPTICVPPAMGPDSSGECSCPVQHRCEGGAESSTRSSSPGCVVDNYHNNSNLPRVPDDSCPYSNRGICYDTKYCLAGTDCTDCGTCGPPVRARWHWNPQTCPSCSCTPWCDTSASPYIGCKDLGLTSMEGVHVKNKQAAAIDLSGNALIKLDDQLLFAGMTDMTILMLKDNNITEIAEGLFSGLSALLLLDLKNNQLSSIADDAFSRLPALTYLYLQNNKLAVLQGKPFAGLSSLTKLYLYDNKISSIEDSTFSELSALTNLYLSGNKLTVLQGNLFAGLSALTALSLLDNQILTIDVSTFSELSALTELYLSGNKLTVLQGNLFAGLSALKELYLYENQISSIEDGAFAQLSALTLLALNGNKLTVLHGHLFVGLSMLTDLILYNNQISNLDDAALSWLSAVTSLVLNNNKLTVLQGTHFVGLSTLTEIELYDNQISSIEDATFSKLSALTELDLQGNKLTVLHRMTFTGLLALIKFYLNDNQISSIEDGAFAQLSALTLLALNGNQLVELNPTIFQNLTNLQILHLSQNQLNAIETPTFTPIATTLQELYLQENAISEVGLVLQEMREHHNLTILTMVGNPSTCHITSKTNHNLNGTIVCTCTEGFGNINVNDSTISTIIDGSRAGGHTIGYLCQSLARVVIIPQTVATLRSQFLLVGPEEQLAAPSSIIQPLEFTEENVFLWNGVYIGANDITVEIIWFNKSKAAFHWMCSPGVDGCNNESFGDIANPPASTQASFFGRDSPASMKVNYNVNTATAVDTPPTFSKRSTTIKMAYSAFYLPARFDSAVKTDAENGVMSKVVAGSELPSPRSLWINQTITSYIPANTTAEHELLTTTANVSIEANRLIPTSVVFKLANNTCKIRHSANVLDVRTITAKTSSYSNSGNTSGASRLGLSTSTVVVVGWEVVVGDPTEMSKATNLSKGNTMKPCTAVLQAHDTVTTEILNITTIEASIKDCWDNGNPLNLNDTRHLSCGGNGECNPDSDPYDGIFKGCKCTNKDYGGRRCDVKLQSCDEKYKKFNVDAGECKTFDPVFETNPKKGAIPGEGLYTTVKELEKNVPFVEDTTVRIQGVELNEAASLFSSGGASNVRFLLSNNAPPSFFVSGVTGEIAAYVAFPLNSTKAVHTYDFDLIAEDELGARSVVHSMTISVKRKPLEQPDVIVPALIGCTAFAVLLGFAVHKLRQRHLAKRDAIAALARARKAYGLVDLQTTAEGGGMSINSGDLVGVTTTTATTNAAFVGLAEEANSDSDVVHLLDPPADLSGVAIEYGNGLATYEDEGEDNSDNNADSDSNSGDYILALADTRPQSKHKNSKQRRNQLSKFVAPTISLGKSTLAAKGLDVLLGVDPKTYMHVKNKVKVMLKEFAKNGTDEDIKNLRSLIDGTYKHPPNADGSPLTAEEIDGQSKTMEELMACSAVCDAGLELHHVLALRLYTTSSYRSINDPMRQSPPVLPHPFAATMYYISDALSKLRELQGKDAAMRNETLVFWRGMKDLQIADEFNNTGGSEMACMSTTSSRDVAEEFALSKSPLLFKFVSNSFMSHGADISFLSVYPGEKEVLYPPLTYLRPINVSEETVGTTVYTIVTVEPVFPK